MRNGIHAFLGVVCLIGSCPICQVMIAAESNNPAGFPDSHYWNAPERGAKVAALIPGRRNPKLTPETLFADWTKQQVERWNKDHPPQPPEEAYQKYAATAPADADLTSDFPVHISPFGRVHSGKPDPERAAAVMVSYCPFCQSLSMSLQFDPKNPYHAVTSCCETHLYGREKDYPPNYSLRPNANVRFLHLDDTWQEIPCTLYRDKNGVEWELFIKTIFDHKRWLDQGCQLVKQFGEKFKETADPLYAHKIAILLDKVADTYYGLPLGAGNKLCNGKDGKPLTRAEWEAVPRPAIFAVSYLGAWSKREPYSSPGWLNMLGEHIWVEPFGRVRHHPAFKQVSQKLYGDPEALDKKVMTRLLRELSLMFQSVFSQKLLHNYQEAIYVDLWLLGVLLQDKVLIDFAGPCQELSMYNHSYQDGLNGEGAPNYMDMPGGYYYPYLKDPRGWLQYQPKFLDDNPFYWSASEEMHKLKTVRGLELEFGDQHEHAFAGHFLADASQVREREKLGSRNWAGYGVGLIRVGGPGHRQEIGLDYTRATLHNARDALSLECWVDGVPVLRKGGYAAYWCDAALQWNRPEFQALKQMDYPHEIAQAGQPPDNWSWNYSHSPLCQNTVTVDEKSTGAGWGDNRGYGETITFKGGETAGVPGSGFQVLDVRDHYSWWHVGKDVSEFRRTVIAVEGPDGRPYSLDLLRLTGGQRHALYTNAWGESAEDHLPKATGQAENLGSFFMGDQVPEDKDSYRTFQQVRKIEKLAPPDQAWDLTWKTDYAAYAPRDLGGKPFKRPLPESIGQVRLRLVGLKQTEGETQLLRGKGPWIGWMRQSLSGGHRVDGNVAYMDARDFLIECRQAKTGAKALDSVFAHVLEGYREGENSAIKSVTQLKTTSLRGPERHIVALQLEMTGGHTDTVLYQSEAGTVKLPEGTETDARYALIRRDARQKVIEVEACRGTYMRAGKFAASMSGDLTGTIVDVIGDLTGTRQESALILKPDKAWPAGANLKDRQLLIRFESVLREPCNEGYRVEKVTELPGGLVRVDLQDHAPLVVSWHEVVLLPSDKPNVIRTNRPMVDHGNNPWYCGMKIWFPERAKTYTIKSVNEVGGGYGGDTVELVENVNLAAEGIRVGDWYVIYGVRPGLKVTVPNDFCWRQEPARDWQQYGLRATGTVTVKCPATAGALAYRMGSGKWQEAAGGRVTFPGSEAGDQSVSLIVSKPAWLNLEDAEAPSLVRVALDDKPLDLQSLGDLGWIDPPRRVALEFRDAGNPMDLASLQVMLSGKRIDGPKAGLVKTTAGTDGRSLVLEVDLEKSLASERLQARRHALDVVLSDKSVDRRQTSVRLSYISKVPLDPNALYVSDLKALRSFAHGGLILDKDYVGNVAEIAGRVYPKCITLCPDPSPDGTHGEVIHQLPADRGPLSLKADLGISASSHGYGSAVFMVQVGNGPDGPWETLYTSPVLRGGGEPVSISVDLRQAGYLRLYTTDADDGINSDHAVWGNVRLR